jgi:hypothetical protein
MPDAISSFYAEKSSDAADEMARTEDYRKLRAEAIVFEGRFLASLSGEQRALYDHADECWQVMASMTHDAIYKSAFLDGYAAGRIIDGESLHYD